MSREAIASVVNALADLLMFARNAEAADKAEF